MPTWAISAASRSACRWIYFVLPALLLNYMGQGAMILSADPATRSPRSRIRSSTWRRMMFRLPLVLLATAATVIASQAVISGAFSVTQQAIQLGFIPRLRITHTSESGGGANLHPGRSTGR